MTEHEQNLAKRHRARNSVLEEAYGPQDGLLARLDESDGVVDVEVEHARHDKRDLFHVVFRYDSIHSHFAEMHGLEFVCAYNSYRTDRWWERGPFEQRRLVGVFKRERVDDD